LYFDCFYQTEDVDLLETDWGTITIHARVIESPCVVKQASKWIRTDTLALVNLQNKFHLSIIDEVISNVFLYHLVCVDDIMANDIGNTILALSCLLKHVIICLHTLLCKS